MAATEQFIKDAIAGGYVVENLRFNGEILYPNTFSSRGDIGLSDLLLSPLAWQACGKTRGWPIIHMVNMKRGEEQSEHYWLFMQHVFVDYLADGLSIEDSLAKL